MTISTFANKVTSFYENLKPPELSQLGLTTINPFTSYPASQCMGEFYNRYFNDNRRRIFIIGINPGKHGSGITGVPFTDTKALNDDCQIEIPLPNNKELSSTFIYKVISEYGDVSHFYRHFFLTAACPCGFTKAGNNFNYYDSREAQDALKDYIYKTMKEQVEFGAERAVAIVLGTGKNAKFLEQLNSDLKLFDHMLVLEHPRYVMQYKRKHLDSYVKKYLEVLNEAQKLVGHSNDQPGNSPGATEVL